MKDEIYLHSQQRFLCSCPPPGMGVASPPLLLPVCCRMAPFLPAPTSLACRSSLVPCGTSKMSLSLWLLRVAAVLQLLWAKPTCSRAANGSQSLGQRLKIIPFLPFCTCGHPQSSHPQLAFLLFLPNSPWLKGEDLGVFEGQFSSAAADVFIAGVEDQAQGEHPHCSCCMPGEAPLVGQGGRQDPGPTWG